MLQPSVQRAAIIFSMGVFCVLLLPSLAQDGMFMDGELYAAVAHNQANGIGTFWQPRFSQVGLAGLTTFHEHPPLVFGMQGSWFKLLGSAFWVERAYALCMALLTALLLLVLWRQLVPEGNARNMGWWAILLWIMVPTVHWCFHNNMHENTMGVFTTAAVLCSVVAMRKGWLWIGAAAVLVFLASMAKGLPGLFPLAAPVLLWIALRQGTLRRAVLLSVVMTLGVVAFYSALMLLPEAKASLETYVDSRLLHRIAVNPTVEYRFATLEMLLSNMIGPLLVGGLLVWVIRRKRPYVSNLNTPALAMGLIGLSGVAPLMLTMVQKSFYMAAALPIIALAIALWSAPALAAWLYTWAPSGSRVRVLKVIGIVLIIAAIGVSIIRFGEPRRDAELLADVHRIGSAVQQHELVGVEPGLWNDWGLQTYLMRYHFISVDANSEGSTWYITAKGEVPLDTASYAQQHIDLRELDLWRRIQ